MGSRPLADDEGSDRVKLSILELLNRKYGIVEEDFISAELSAVPAFRASDVGFDRSLIGAYGHDDRVCAYAALAALLRKSGLDPAPYEHTSRLRACLNQYGLLTGCRGDLPYARRRALFAEILADNDARAALQERLRNDPNKILAVPYRIGVAWNWPGLLAAYTLIKQRLL